MSHESGPEGPRNDKPVILAIFGVLVLYLLLLVAFKGSFFASESSHGEHSEPAASVESESVPAETSAVAEVKTEAEAVEAAAPAEPAAPAVEAQAQETAQAAADANVKADVSDNAKSVMPPFWMALPFAGLLLAIALFPLIPATEHWWESNLHRFYVAAGLGFLTLMYYAFMCDFPVAGHWHFFNNGHVPFTPNGGFQWEIAWAIFCNAIFNEYIAFIVLLFALFTIAGGIRISGDLKASPMVNTTIMAIGATLASFIGTTGAAMLLIRLLLETNKQRKYVAHTVIFFIFCVCNCGGCLLPIGDPPLFLGYLKGVPFLWTFALWKEWIFVNGLILVVYYLWDSFYAYPRESQSDLIHDQMAIKPLSIEGLWPNGLFLLGIVLCVALLDPSKAVPGTNFVPPQYLREVCQLVLVAMSLMFGSAKVREENQFNYGAILEVAALFFGIFICMQAPLQILNETGGKLGYSSADSQKFFWSAGCLSSVLDNAPTYVVFYETGKAVCKDEASKLADDIAKASGEEKTKLETKLTELKSAVVPGTNSDGFGIIASLLVSVSLGSVFMGAMTYIGNGPNFMVKAIAEQSGVKMPSFFGYMAYSCAILLPILVAMTFIFL